MTDERKELFKEAVKEATREWLDETYQTIGRWTVRGIGAAVFSALIYFTLHWNGFNR